MAKKTQVEITRTIEDGEKTRTFRVIVKSNEGKSQSFTLAPDLTAAETNFLRAFQEEWSLKWNHEEAEKVDPSSS